MNFYRLIKIAGYVDFESCGDDTLDNYVQQLVDALKCEDFHYFERLIQNTPIGTCIEDYYNIFIKPFNSTIYEKVLENSSSGLVPEGWCDILEYYMR